MSEESTTKPQPALRQNESQHERWMKYGANVAVMSIVAIVLVGLLVYLAQKHSKRIDTTVGGAQSLSPQTENIVKDLKTKFTIVALYPRLKSEQDQPDQQDYYQPVVDLLNEYSSKNSNITAEVIDPNTEKDKFNKLVTDITNQYGGEIKDYKAIIADLSGQSDAIKKFSDAETAKFRALPFDQIQDDQLYQNMNLAASTVHYSGDLGDLKTAVDGDLSQSVPSYKDAADQIQAVYSGISTKLKIFQAAVQESLKNPSLPAEFKSYIPDAVKRAAEMQKTVDGMLDRFKSLGQLKELNDFKDQLKIKSIVVMGDGGYKIIPFDQIWMTQQKNAFEQEGETTHRLRFAGEQRISTAIAALSDTKKQMVVFLKPPQVPTLIGSLGRTGEYEGGMFSAIASRLHDSNFDVAEKASGMPSPEERPPATPEPTPEQMKSAVWIVLFVPTSNPMMQGMEMPDPAEPMVEDHLKEGGSVFVMAPPPLGMGMPPSPDAYASVFGALGIKVRTDMLMVHETVKQSERRSTDMVAAGARSNQPLFLINQYGNHPITAPLEALDSLMIFCAPVQAAKTIPAGVTVTPLMPVPTSPHAWAATLTKFMTDSGNVAYEPGVDLNNDSSNPLFFAAAVEKTGGARAVVVGSLVSYRSDIMTIPDEKDPDVPRLPGNAEFAMNSIFWLAHRDSMLAISPHTLQMARVEAMTTGKLNFVRVGVLTVGLPLLVILSGLVVYYRRWD